MYRTVTQIDAIVQIVKTNFILLVLLIDNSFKVIKLFCVLMMLFHMFACMWIYFGGLEGGWRD